MTLNGLSMYSKRLTVHDARLELDSVGIADKIDAEFRYHIGRPTISSTDADILENADKPRTTFVTLKYEHGGQSLNNIHYIGETERERKFLHDFANVIEGLCAFHNGGLYHLDVKTSNIVSNDDRIRLIDFGVSSEMKVSREMFLETYSVWPFEVCLLSGHDYDVFSDHIIGEYLQDKFYKGYSSYLRMNDGDVYQNIKLLRKNHRTEELNNVIFPKIDVYSVGVTLACLIMRKVIINKEARQVLHPFCRRLTTPFTDERPTMQEAYEEYKQLLEGLGRT